VNGTPATVEADGTFIAEGLILPEGPNTLTAEGENPETMETDTHEITVTKLPQEDVTYTFDDRGNMTSKTDATGTTDYFWFYTDRLKRIEFPDASRHRYYYDGLGRRVLSKEDGRDDRRFAYDGWNVIGEKTEGGEDFVAYYTRGADMGGGIGGIISVHRNGTPAQYPDGYHTGDYFYHYNHRGDVVSVTDSTGAEVAHYHYDAYGNVVEKTGDFESPYQFSTKEYSSETGLIYYGYRFYMPEEGRWLNKEPLGYVGVWNLYNMIYNNPVNYIDLLGLMGRRYDDEWYKPEHERKSAFRRWLESIGFVFSENRTDTYRSYKDGVERIFTYNVRLQDTSSGTPEWVAYGRPYQKCKINGQEVTGPLPSDAQAAIEVGGTVLGRFKPGFVDPLKTGAQALDEAINPNPNWPER